MLAVVDTSFWIDFHRGAIASGDLKRFQRLALGGEIVLYQFVWLELQVGYRSERERKFLGECRRFSRWTTIESGDADRASELAAIFRKKGFGMGGPDLIILAAAERLGASLIHHDRHFTVALSYPEFTERAWV